MKYAILNSTLFCAGLLLASTSHAALVSQWDMTGQLGTQVSQTASTVATNVSAATLTRGAGLTATGAANSLNSNGWSQQATDFVSFTFTIANGFTLDLASFKVGTQSSATGPGTVGLFYSGDNFTTSLGNLTQPSASLLNTSFDLSLLPSLTGTVEFRFRQVGTLAPNGSATAATGTFRIADYAVGGDQNVTFDGTIAAVPAAVPLPAAVWLLGAGLGALGWTGRRRSRA